MSIFYISDTHFGHKNVLQFDHRPFADTDEMDCALIRNWNENVGANDDVFVVGDFTYKSGYDASWYLRQLSGHKHLVIGNHDGKMLADSRAMKYWESVDKLTWVQDGEMGVVLCHYPMLEWYKSQYGTLLVYGHIHGNKNGTYQVMKAIRPTAYNAAACINGYTPVTLTEMIENNKRFQAED